MRVIGFSFLVIVFDQLSKLYVKGFSFPFSHKGISYGKISPILENHLNLTFVENPGIAFGMYFGQGFKIFSGIASIIVIAGIFYLIYKAKKDKSLIKLSYALIAGGALGNLIDRVFYGVIYNYAPLFFGKVVDFIEIRLNYFPGSFVCNFADIAVFAGLLLLVKESFKKKVLLIPAAAESFSNKA